MDGGESFFRWFNQEDQEAEIAEVIKEEIWLDPLKYCFSMGEELDDKSKYGKF